MPADLKTLETSLSKLTEYVADIEGVRKYLKTCIDTMVKHETASEALETKMDNFIKELKKTKATALSAEDKKSLDADITAWGHTQASLELKNSSAYCNTLLTKLLTALKEVPKAK